MEEIFNHVNLKKYLIECKNILVISKKNDVFKSLNEFKTKIVIVDDDNNFNDINIDYNICFVDSINVDLNKLFSIIKKYIILFGMENNENIKSSMELNDDWIYDNNDWTFDNNIVIIKKREENEKNIICVIKENAVFYNPKSFELFDYYFNLNYKIVKKNTNNVTDFIEEKNKINNTIVFIYDTFLNEFDYITMKYIQEHKKIFSLIFILTQDWWNGVPRVCEYHNKVTTEVFMANNYKVVVASNNTNELSKFNGRDYSLYQNNLIFYNYWGIYKSSIMKFNLFPERKILISGTLHITRYPERLKMSILNNNYIETYKYNNKDTQSINNNFNNTLNRYLVCFTSSVYIRSKTYKKNINTHIILLKTFEILASGSLLIVPDYEEPYLKKIGLIKGEHYLTLNFNSDLNEQINNLFDENNISNINNIRLCGYNYAINNLTNKQKFIEMNEIFTKS